VRYVRMVILRVVLCGMRQLSSYAVLRSWPGATESCCIVCRMDACTSGVMLLLRPKACYMIPVLL
jgi:23S rRNA-/tRNA-specific pseudouridylate synthase